MKKYFPFSERKDLYVFICTHILDGRKPIKFVTHHFDDGNWQFLCGGMHSESDAVIISIQEVCELDRSVEELCDLPVGYCASRKNVSAKWIKARIPDEKAYPEHLCNE